MKVKLKEEKLLRRLYPNLYPPALSKSKQIMQWILSCNQNVFVSSHPIPDTKLEHKTQQNDNKLNYKMYYKSVIVHKNRIFTYFENKVKKLNNMIIIIVIIKHG